MRDPIHRLTVSSDSRRVTAQGAVEAVEWDIVSGSVTLLPGSRRSEVPVDDLIWPGGTVTLSEAGDYAIVTEYNHVVPCKVERRS